MNDQAETLTSRIIEVIKQLRLQKGLTLEELADRAGLHRTTISLLERGERSPTMQVIVQLAEALDQKLSTLISEAEDPGEISQGSEDAVQLAEFQKRETDLAHFRNEDFLQECAGLNLAQLKAAIEATYATLDLIDYQLVSRRLAPIEKLVELANLSSMVGNLIGAEIAAASNGLYERNRPHTYPDLLPLKPPAKELELKVALETNKPKGHLPKPGRYITFRYILGERDGKYTRGKDSRGDTLWIWEVRVGTLGKEDFSISNTEGDSGKTAVVKTEAFYNMKAVYFNPGISPHGVSTLGRMGLA